MPPLLPARCPQDHSIRAFRAAARERQRDAAVLADAGRRLAAVYLYGYGAEMTVKAAYFAAIGRPEDDPITIGDLWTALRGGARHGVTFADLHDVAAWGRLLVATRSATGGLAYPDPTFARQVVIQCQRVYDLWRETLRYHVNRPYPHELDRVRVATEWLLGRTHEL